MKLAIPLFLVISLCPADICKDTIYDTITVKQTVIDTVHRLDYDSLTVSLLEKSQAFYSDSFNNILWLVGIIIAIGCAVFGGLGTFNWWKAKKYNEEMKKEVENWIKEIKELARDNEKIKQVQEHLAGFIEKIIGINENYLETSKELKRLLEETLKQMSGIIDTILESKGKK